MIITQNIVRDMLRLLSSSKGAENLLHLPFCHNLSLLSSKPNWSFMTKLLLLPHPMSLCVLVILKRMKLQSRLEPRINLRQRIKLMIHHLRWFKILPQIQLPIVLFISNDQVSIQFFAPLLRALLKSLHSTLTHVLPKITTLSKIFLKNPLRCQLSKSFKVSLLNKRHC
jgi:hypothetical protein